jgi:hypothetical protein
MKIVRSVTGRFVKLVLTDEDIHSIIPNRNLVLLTKKEAKEVSEIAKTISSDREPKRSKSRKSK